jgi:hypothetical protein
MIAILLVMKLRGRSYRRLSDVDRRMDEFRISENHFESKRGDRRISHRVLPVNMTDRKLRFAAIPA